MYELRLDLRKNQFHIPRHFYNQKTIITLRDISEEGKYQGGINQKLDFYYHLLTTTSFYLDIEIKHLDIFASKYYIKNFYNRIIASYHGSTLPQISSPINDLFFYKFVIPIDTYSELFTLSSQLSNFCLLSTGKTSLISRILYKSFNSKAVYFGKKGYETSKHQITDEDIIKYNLININPSTQIGGIIGGEQILYSLGLNFYNNYFQEKKINAVYLPFIIEDIDDFKNFVKMSGLLFYGFSITMPFKRKIFSDKQNIEPVNPINLWIPSKNETYLTDEYAFRKSFVELGITEKTNVFIIGKGAMANLAISLLANNNIKIVSSREDIIYNNETPSLLINASPRNDITPNKLFDYVLDLPYYNKKTKLIEYCIKNKIKYIDGHQFWKWQAEKQLNIFVAITHYKVWDIFIYS